MSSPAAPRPARWLPIAGWLREYTRRDAQGDLVAGIITAIVLVPQGMAFALLAGLPPEMGLYTSVLPPIAYALFGTSRTLAVGPVSVAALMVAQALRDLPPGTDPVAAALVLALLGGALLLAMGFLRLGVVENVLSHPVLSGFTLAAATLILINQLPSLLGFRWDGSPAHAAAELGTHPATALLGACAVILLLLMDRPLQRLLRSLGLSDANARLCSRGGPLAVIVIATLAVAEVPGLSNSVAKVGALPSGLPLPRLPSLPLPLLAQLVLPAVLIALVSYVESLSIAKALAARRRERIDANQELIALGAANIGAALGGGMPVAGGFSRTMVNFQAGARTQLASILTALLVGLVALTAASMLAGVPKLALAAIIIVAVARLVDIPSIRALWRYDRIDGAVFAVTVIGVLALGIEKGIAAGVIASLVGFSARNARPHIAVLGRIRGSEHFRNVRRHDVETWPHLLFVRPDENFTFANAGFLESWLGNAVSEHPDVRHLVLVMSSVNTIDSTALERLERLLEALRETGVTLHLTDVKGPLMDRMQTTTLMRSLPPGQVFLSAHAAAEALAKAGRDS
jgi:SulP family sulfate permease